jgi:nicotinate phosphoribosyltransferase
MNLPDLQSPLLTDLYQLTMAAGYWRQGMAERESVFHLFFRKLPFASGYAIAAGLGDVVAWLEKFRFNAAELAYLATIPGRDGKPIFEAGFLAWLGELRWTCDVDAIPEGTAVFPHQPLLRIRGPLVQAQLVETALLNMVNFQTLIATKAARVCEAAGGDAVLEFGLRRAQGPHGAVMATRAAYIGGCSATSNVLAAMALNIPVKGTHAHSWVMSFDTEREAFAAYADAMPNNCVFLVDTYDTLEGVQHAVEIGRELRARGHELAGIRLDSGDLAQLSIAARAILDAGGFPQASIVASNDLDEYQITSLKQQGAKIDVWGVGTAMVTGGAQSALGGVYKLGAIRDTAGQWQPKVKLSEQVVKVSNPGVLQVARFAAGGVFQRDVLFDTLHPFSSVEPHVELLEPVYRRGALVRPLPTLQEIQQRTRHQLQQLPEAIRCLEQPEKYAVDLEPGLEARKLAMVAKYRA